MTTSEQAKLSEIESLCKPISEWLTENFSPYAAVVIDSEQAKLVTTEQGLPL